MIYKLRSDSTKYKYLDLNMLDFVDDRPEELSMDDVFSFYKKNITMGAWWKTVATDFISSSKKIDQIPDISTWESGCLVLSPKAFRYLGELLSDSGEFLDVSISGEIFKIFNCTDIVNADEEKCVMTYFEDTVVDIKELVFNEGELTGRQVFKCPFEHYQSLFCSEKFKAIVKDFELTGILFQSEKTGYYGMGE